MSDVEEITQLYMAYARGLDEKAFDLARAVFDDDCEVVGTFAHGPIDEYFPAIQAKVEEYRVTMHHVGNVLIQVSGDAASAESYTVAYHLEPVAGGDPWIVAVCYSDSLRRRDGTWRVSRRRVTRFWERSAL